MVSLPVLVAGLQEEAWLLDQNTRPPQYTLGYLLHSAEIVSLKSSQRHKTHTAKIQWSNITTFGRPFTVCKTLGPFGLMPVLLCISYQLVCIMIT